MRAYGSDPKRIRAHEKAASLAHRYYHENRNADTANIWMSNLWSALYELFTCPRAEIDCELRMLERRRKWPVRRPSECTLSKSYRTTRTGLMGKLFEGIYMHSHTRIGVKNLVLWSHLRSMKNWTIRQ